MPHSRAPSLLHLAGFTIALIVAPLAAQNQPGGRPNTVTSASPSEPISTILEAFSSHSIVGLGDAHGNEQVDAFRLALIRDPRFAVTVNDIVVEWGNSLYQDALDRYLRGDSVANPVWHLLEDLSAAPGWEMPIYETFFRAVRALNLSLAPERQLRVLLGHPPLDWDRIQTLADLQAQDREDNDAFVADLIRREVLAKGRRALVALGYGHLLRFSPAKRDGSNSQSTIQLLEGDRTATFTVFPLVRFSRDVLTLQSTVASWPNPSLAEVRGTILGRTPIRFYFPTLPAEFSDPNPPFDALPIEQQFDAVLYLGPPSAMTLSPAVSPTRCLDSGYMEMRAKRLAITQPNPPADGQGALDQLKRLCATFKK